MRTVPNLIFATLVGLMSSASAWASGDGAIPNPTTSWNATWNEVLLELWAIGILFGVAAIYLLIRYRAKSPDDVGTAKKLTMGQALAWSLVPAALFLAVDFLLAGKGWSLWNIQRTVPENAMEIRVTASQWAFTYEYPNGVEISSTERDEDADLFSQEIMDGDMVVPVGQPIVLRMTADDVIHSFGLTDYRLKEDIMPGRVTYLWFIPTDPLVSKVVCVEFCGTNHAQMFNRVVAVPQGKYDAWLAVKKEQAMLDDAKKAAPQLARADNIQ